MNKSIQLGAPSLTGKGANEWVAETFKDAVFPLKLKATNLVAHAVNFPEVIGFHLKPIPHPDTSFEFEALNYAALQRLVSSIEQVATLHNHAAMLQIEWDDGVVEPVEVEQEPVKVDVTKAVKKPVKGA